MTDNEIIQTLECLFGRVDCRKCPYSPRYEFPLCQRQVAKDTFDLINRQKAEIEQWKEEANKYQNLWCIATDDIFKAKSEAVKEYHIKAKACLKANRDFEQQLGSNYTARTIKEIETRFDNILKEMENRY